jgi:hypothetical protein
MRLRFKNPSRQAASLAVLCRRVYIGIVVGVVENVWSAAGLQGKSLSGWIGPLNCILPVCGAKPLAIMESARRWSMKWVELEGCSRPRHRLPPLGKQLRTCVKLTQFESTYALSAKIDREAARERRFVAE